MSYIDAYSSYRDTSRLYLNRNEYAGNYVKESKVKATDENTASSKTTESLSAEAKSLLNELKQKYGDTDFFVANYETDEEANQYLSRGNKEYSVLIEPEILEEMAKDESAKEKYLSAIDDARGNIEDVKQELTKNGDESVLADIKSIGISIKADGKVSLFAQMEKTSDAGNKQLEKRLEKKKEEKKAESKERQKTYLEKIRDNSGDTIQAKTLSAESKEELIEKLRSFSWDDVPEDILPEKGGRFDMAM